MEGQQILALYKERNQLAIQETDLSYGKQLQALAKRYGIGKSKVKTDLFRMRQKLRKELEMEGIGI